MSGVGLKDETKTEEKKRLTEKDMEAAAADSDDEQRDIVEAKLANAAVITPPDGGYGWVIVIASFFANLFVDGIIFTVGQSLLSIWEREFETSAMAASWAQSLLGGCYLLAGPLASALANRFGCRSVVIGGTVMVFIGFMTSVLVPALPILYVTFGIIGGIGFGLVYLPAIVIVNQWFEKKRAFALGLAVCGSGIGTTIFSQINPLLLNLNHGNWRTFLMNIAVISLLCIVCGLFFKTPQANEKQVEEVAKIVTSYQEQRQHSKSPFSGTPAATLQEETPAEANGGGGDQNETQQSGNDSEDPFRRRVTSCNARVGDRPTRKRWFSTSGDQPDTTMRLAVERGSVNLMQSQRRLSAITGTVERRPFLSTLELHAAKHDKNVWSQPDLARDISKKGVDDMNRPLSKVAIFYPGSTVSLSQRTAKRVVPKPDEPASVQQHSAEQTNGAAQLVGDSDEKKGGTHWKKAIAEALGSMLDLSLFRSVTFIILAISGFLTLCCLFVPFIYLGAQASSIGVSLERQAFLLTSLGVINIIGRIICGIISDLPSVDPLTVSNIAITAGGIATFCVPFLTEFWMYIVYTIPFALAVAAFSALRSVICVELLGLERLSSAFGMLLLFMGCAALIGPPTAAALKDFTGNYDLSFYLMGTLLALSGIIMIPLRRVSAWEQRRDEAKRRRLSSKDNRTPAELEPLNASGKETNAAK